MAVVSDSGPLIWLAKAGRLGLLRALFGEVVVPSEVYREVVSEGLRLGFSDALAVEEAVKEGWVRVHALDGEAHGLAVRLAEGAGEIHFGEAQALALAREMGVMLLMDESCGRALAEALGVEARGTLFVVLRALRLGLLDGGEAKDVVSRLVGLGMRLDPRLLARVFNEIDGFGA